MVVVVAVVVVAAARTTGFGVIGFVVVVVVVATASSLTGSAVNEAFMWRDTCLHGPKSKQQWRKSECDSFANISTEKHETRENRYKDST